MSKSKKRRKKKNRIPEYKDENINLNNENQEQFPNNFQLNNLQDIIKNVNLDEISEMFNQVNNMQEGEENLDILNKIGINKNTLGLLNSLKSIVNANNEDLMKVMEFYGLYRIINRNQK